MKKTRKWQDRLRQKVKEFVEELHDWYSDYINYRVSFKDRDRFHLDIIEDDCSHIHIHGEYQEDGTLYVSYFSSSVTMGLTDEVLDFVRDVDLNEEN